MMRVFSRMAQVQGTRAFAGSREYDLAVIGGGPGGIY